MNAMLKRVFDFLAGFPDAGESAFGWVAARGQDAKKFSARDDIEAGAFSSQQVEDRAVGIRFDRVTDQMIDAGECAFQPLVMIADCAGTVDVKRRSEFLSDLIQVGSFTMKLAIAVMKGMHGEKCSGRCFSVIPSCIDSEGPRNISEPFRITAALISGYAPFFFV
jgi:hypothetical protein